MFNSDGPPSDAGTDTFKNIERFVGSGYDDTIIGGSFSNEKTSTVALSGITALSFDGGKGHDTLVFKGSIGDVDIAHDFSEIDGDTFAAQVKHIEFIKFDEFTVKLKQFDAALTNRVGNSHVSGAGLSELIVGHKSQADHLSGGKGDDALIGLGGDDLLHGGKGQDLLLGNDGADRLKGGDGADRLKGGAGKDALFGGAGKDDVQGGAGADSLHGGNGGDTLGGGKGDDVLFGGDGGDILNGGLGDDRLAGGKGPDTFVFSTALGPHNVDTIADFGAGDVIALDASIFQGIGPKGDLADALFATSLFDTGVHPIHPDARIIYNPLSGDIFYDENGNQPGGLTLFAGSPRTRCSTTPPSWCCDRPGTADRRLVPAGAETKTSYGVKLRQQIIAADIIRAHDGCRPWPTKSTQRRSRVALTRLISASPRRDACSPQ